VTSSNLEPFNSVTITDTAGNVIATAAVQRR
jgi:hypothetical protein